MATHITNIAVGLGFIAIVGSHTLPLAVAFAAPQATKRTVRRAAAPVTPSPKIFGLTNVRTYADSSRCFADNSGCDFGFVSSRRFAISSYFRQVQDVFVSSDETGQGKDLDYDFKGIWKHDSLGDNRTGSSITFGQFRFTGAIDSLVIISDREGVDDLTACGVNVYNLDQSTWRLVGVLKALDVLGACEVQFKVNKVTIPRHLRGFYHQLTFQNGRFEDTSDY